MLKKNIAVMFAFFCFVKTTNATDRSLVDVTTYRGSDPIYERFMQNFPTVRLYQRGTLSPSQKLVVSQLTLKTIVDNYDAIFILSSGLRAIVIHQDSRIYCSYMPAGAACPGVVGWADAGSGVLNVVASTESSSIFAGAENLNIDACGADTACLNAAVFLRSGRQVIHHELFHSLDSNPNSDAWEALNPEGWTARANTGASVALSSSIDGFVSSYAATGIVEDRAETFAHMMNSSNRVTDIAEDDSHIRSKILALKAYLRTLCRNNTGCRIPSAFADYE